MDNLGKMLFITLLTCLISNVTLKPIVNLTASVVPHSYDLFILMEESGDIDGVATIEIEVKNETKKIKLNSYNLTINSVILFTNTNDYPVASFELNNEDQVLTVTMENPLKIGSYALAVFYNKNNNNTRGFSLNGNARNIFPSFDEPQFKSEFHFTIACSPEYRILSNLKMVKSEIELGTVMINLTSKKEVLTNSLFVTLASSKESEVHEFNPKIDLAYSNKTEFQQN